MLKELGTIHTGSTPKTNDESLFGGDYPFVTPGDLDSSKPIEFTSRTLTEAGLKTSDLLPKDSILVCCIGSLGKIGIAGRPLVTNQQINAVVFDQKQVDPRYGLLACRRLKSQLETMAPATTVPIVNKSRFSELKIPVPPLSEQRRIAAILDQAETLRTQRRTALALLDTLTQSIFLDMFGDPVTNPMKWKQLRIEEIGKVITGNTPSRANSSFYGNDVEWIKSDNINTPNSYLTKSSEGLSLAGKAVARTVPALSILVTCIAGSPDCIGNAAMTDREVSFNQQINALVTKNADPHFVYAQMMVGKRLIQQASTKGMKGMVSKSRFEQIVFIAPPLPLQQTFATRIQAIEALKSTHRIALAQLDALFASLQHRAFSGTL